MLYERWVKEWKSALAENFFLRALCLLLGVALVVTVFTLRGKDRIIIVPPKIEREFWVDKDTVSDTYIEQMAVFLATFAGNMSPVNAEYNAKLILSYMEPAAAAELRGDIAGQAYYFKKNNITQAFFPEGVKVDREKLQVSIEGTAVRYVGNVKVSQEKMIMHVRFKIRDYNLKVEELYVTYPEREERRIKEKEEEMVYTPEERREKERRRR